VLGNHDVKNGHGEAQMAALGMPGPWWARHVDDVLLIGLDTAVSFSWHHFVELGVFPDRLVIRAVNQEGRVADEASVVP
jgi:hypothetical protein